jgi:hypothetical protein
MSYKMRVRSLVLVGALLGALATASVLAQPAAGPAPKAAGARAVAQSKAGSTGPVRNQAALKGEEIVTIRYFKIRKGSFPQFLAASQNGVWPYFEKIGARILGMWQVIPDPEGAGVAADYDEAYLVTRYASLEHWAATRNAASLGGDGPDYAALQAALATRQSLTLETKVTYLKGAVGPLGPIFLPPTGEKFTPLPKGAVAP